MVGTNPGGSRQREWLIITTVLLVSSRILHGGGKNQETVKQALSKASNQQRTILLFWHQMVFTSWDRELFVISWPFVRPATICHFSSASGTTDPTFTQLRWGCAGTTFSRRDLRNYITHRCKIALISTSRIEPPGMREDAGSMVAEKRRKESIHVNPTWF